MSAGVLRPSCTHAQTPTMHTYPTRNRHINRGNRERAPLLAMSAQPCGDRSNEPRRPRKHDNPVCLWTVEVATEPLCRNMRANARTHRRIASGAYLAYEFGYMRDATHGLPAICDKPLGPNVLLTKNHTKGAVRCAFWAGPTAQGPHVYCRCVPTRARHAHVAGSPGRGKASRHLAGLRQPVGRRKSGRRKAVMARGRQERNPICWRGGMRNSQMVGMESSAMSIAYGSTQAARPSTHIIQSNARALPTPTKHDAQGHDRCWRHRCPRGGGCHTPAGGRRTAHPTFRITSLAPLSSLGRCGDACLNMSPCASRKFHIGPTTAHIDWKPVGQLRAP